MPLAIPQTSIRISLNQIAFADCLEQLKEISGIELVELRNESTPGFCDHYVFAERKNEPWAKAFSEFITTSNFPLEFLSDKGYLEFPSPEEGDVAAYFTRAELGTVKRLFTHWGIYEHGKVTSRFGSSSIFRHSIEVVPQIYGDEATFLRKIPKETE